MSLLEVHDLHVRFGAVQPVAGVSCRVERGEIVGIVGESGSGKSVTALAVLGLLRFGHGKVTRGRIMFEGRDLVTLPEAEMRRLRGRQIALVTQNPMTALGPVHTVGSQLAETARLHLGLSRAAARRRAIELLASMRVPAPERVYGRYPHELSGGLKQRVVIAMALMGDPVLIVADEPTTALDATVQAQILGLLDGLVHTRGIGLLLITHDMSVVAQMCGRVVVMYAGRAVEQGTVADVLLAPRHPYTRALIRCIPRGAASRGTLVAVPGAAPSPAQYPQGCRFHPRCPAAMAVCTTEAPMLRDGVACHLYDAA